jgi:hypothetical protein
MQMKKKGTESLGRVSAERLPSLPWLLIPDFEGVELASSSEAAHRLRYTKPSLHQHNHHLDKIIIFRQIRILLIICKAAAMIPVPKVYFSSPTTSSSSRPASLLP